MEKPAAGARLIIVCGLPGSGKTTYATKLEAELPAIRFCPDEWMDALSLDLWDEGLRTRIESLQWQFGQRLLAWGLTVIIEWGTWGRSERDGLRLRARELEPQLSCIIFPLRLKSCSREFSAGVWRTRP